MLGDEKRGKLIAVVVPLPLDGPFTYLFESDAELVAGQFVRVPFGKKIVTGVVWHGEPDSQVNLNKIKSVDEVLNLRPLPQTILQMIDELAWETLAPRGALLRSAMSVPAALEPGPQKKMLMWPASDSAVEKPADFTKLQQSLGEAGLATQSELSKLAKLTPKRVQNLIDHGLISPTIQDLDEIAFRQKFTFRPAGLSAQQVKSWQEIDSFWSANPQGEVLLEGVPGSGKTEVYFQAIAAVLDASGAALVLLPEIALSAQWLERFEQRFGGPPALWHSACTAAQRRKTWKDIAKGDVKVLVGTRSALFLPFPRLNLIIIDEEHDPSYKQEDGVVYDARMAARLRAHNDSSFLISSSATPSLDTLVHIENRGGLRTVMKKSHGEAAPPAIQIADIRSKDRRAGFIGLELADALRQNLADGRQSMLFLNRRGFAPLMTCRACGYRFDCSNCTAWLTIHKYRQRMLCHHCGYNRPLPEHCPDCGTLDCAVAVGPGVERIADEVSRFLPQARLASVTSDTINSGKRANEFVHSMNAGEIDVVIGTQLIAKGHHFPKLTLVGVVDADASLGASDPRASERCFQLLYQLAGRAGRADIRGRVILQTRSPDHPVIAALAQGDRREFQALEREERKMAGLPPFGRLAAFIISGRDNQDVRHLGLKLVRNAPDQKDIKVLGPAPAPLAMLRGLYRERILIKAALETDLPTVLRSWLKMVPVPSRLRLTVDVDPQSFY